MVARSAVPLDVQKVITWSLAPAHQRERTAGDVEALLSEATADGAVSELARQRMLPLGGSRLLAAHAGAVTDPARARIAEHVLLQRRRSDLAELIIGDLWRQFGAAGIAAAPLKGPTLARRIYGDSALRPFSDIDFLVAEDRLTEAVALVERAGWRQVGDPVDRSGRPLLHFTLTDANLGLPPVELHWRLHWLESRFAQEALDRRSADGVLEPHDELLALFAFYARDGLQGLRYPVDIAAWLESHQDALDPHRWRELLARHAELASCARASLAATAAVIGLSARTATALGGPLTARERLALRCAAPFPEGDEDALRATVALVNYLLAPRRQVPGLVVRYALAPRAGVEQRLPSRASIRQSGLAMSATNVRRRVSHQLRVSRRLLGRRPPQAVENR